MAAPITINIVNKRDDKKDQLNLLFTATAQRDLVGITEKVSTPLAQITSNKITFSMVDGGRLYVGCGALANPPLPEGNQYFGWIEFTKKDSDEGVWINLTNVDLVGLPLALSGKDMAGNAWQLGYKASINDIVKQIKTTALTTITEPAVVVCKTGQTKIIAPNKSPQSYQNSIQQGNSTQRIGAFDQYLAKLSQGAAQLVISSDTPKGGTSKVFTGSFLAAKNDTDPIISMVSEEGDTFVVRRGQFTSKIIFECDGGTLEYNKVVVKQNVTDESAQSVITNSVFRNLLIGMNEGYFTTNTINYSDNFPFLEPFAQEKSNKYAQILHEASNSYGFPYADSNLKVLVIANPAEPIELTIMTDDVPFGFGTPSPDSPNTPRGGKYSFVIGAKSDLGIITIGNCRYIPSADKAYSGILPTLSDWTQMFFSKTGRFIWIKTTGDGFVVADNCFLSGSNPATLIWTNKQLQWPSDVVWNLQAPSPPKPTNEAQLLHADE